MRGVWGQEGGMEIDGKEMEGGWNQAWEMENDR